MSENSINTLISACFNILADDFTIFLNRKESAKTIHSKMVKSAKNEIRCKIYSQRNDITETRSDEPR